jgi:hypothetical protein
MAHELSPLSLIPEIGQSKSDAKGRWKYGSPINRETLKRVTRGNQG